MAAGWLAAPQPVGPTRYVFPPAEEWPDGDAILMGGQLDPATLIAAYRRGLFPMIAHAPDPVLVWWSPEPRAILPLAGFRVTRSLARSARRFEVRVDTCFSDVIARCADPSRPRGWITPEFIDAYTTLHELGWAHSVEIFDRQGVLAGGLYGVSIDVPHPARRIEGGADGARRVDARLGDDPPRRAVDEQPSRIAGRRGGAAPPISAVTDGSRPLMTTGPSGASCRDQRESSLSGGEVRFCGSAVFAFFGLSSTRGRFVRAWPCFDCTWIRALIKE